MAVAVLVSGCGGGATATGERRAAEASAAAPRGGSDGGWMGGAPDGGGADGSAGALADSAEADRETIAFSDGGPATTTASAAGRAGAPAPDVSPLRAGNIDDNAEFDGFLAYLDRIESLGIPFRPMDVRGRVVVTVRDDSGRPVAGAKVTVSAGQERVVELRTTADGTVRFHPAAYGVRAATYRMSVVGGSGGAVEAAPGTDVTLRGAAASVAERVPLDIAFAIDTTGSMDDEIERLKDSVRSVVSRIEALPGRPDVRLAMTVFRDEGDAYVTATHDFTSDVAAFDEALSSIGADGGGDVPEALDEAIDEVLAKPAWRPAGEATQLVFVVGDAGGHPDRNVARPYTESAKDAAARGIKLIPIAASSTDDQAEVAFRQMAQFTGARFVFLAYGAGGAAVGGSTDVGPTDYEELSLDDLIVRLVADELAARTGAEVAVPTSAPTTTRPQGQ